MRPFRAIQASGRAAAGASGIKSGLLHWWDLEEASGLRADAHGSKPLTPVGTVGNVAAKNGNGSNASSGGYLQSTGSTSLATGDFTIAGVFKTSQSNYGIITRNGSAAGSDRQFLVLIEGAVFLLTVSTNGTSNAATASTGSSLNDGVLHTYICWRDTAASTINVQIDGGSVVSAAFSGASALYSATDPGFTLHGVGSGTYVTGGVGDSTGIWNRMLTSTERTALYNGGAWRNYAGLAGI